MPVLKLFYISNNFKHCSFYRFGTWWAGSCYQNPVMTTRGKNLRQGRQVSKIKTEVKNGSCFSYSLHTEGDSNRFFCWHLGQNRQSEVEIVTTNLQFSCLAQVMFTVLKLFKHVHLLHRFLNVQEKCVQKTKLQQYLIIHKHNCAFI